MISWLSSIKLAFPPACVSRPRFAIGRGGGLSGHQHGVVAPLTSVGSEEARLRAGLRPPLKLHVQVSCMQLSRRLSDPG